MLCDILSSDEDVGVIVVDPKSVDYQFLRGGKYQKFSGDDDILSADKRWIWRGIDLLDRESIDSGYIWKTMYWLEDEMDRRYKLMKSEGCVDWKDYVNLLCKHNSDIDYGKSSRWRGDEAYSVDGR